VISNYDLSVCMRLSVQVLDIVGRFRFSEICMSKQPFEFLTLHNCFDSPERVLQDHVSLYEVQKIHFVKHYCHLVLCQQQCDRIWHGVGLQTVRVLNLLDGAKILPKSSTLWVGCNNITDKETTDGLRRYKLPDNLPDEASPGDWLGLRSQADLYSPINDSSLCSLSKLFLKMFSDDEQTMSLSSLFHVFMTLSVKKCWRRSVLTRFLFSFNGCPLVLFIVYSKNVLKLTMYDLEYFDEIGSDTSVFQRPQS